jgi:hypothetical protein
MNEVLAKVKAIDCSQEKPEILQQCISELVRIISIQDREIEKLRTEVWRNNVLNISSDDASQRQNSVLSVMFMRLFFQ